MGLWSGAALRSVFQLMNGEHITQQLIKKEKETRGGRCLIEATTPVRSCAQSGIGGVGPR